MAVLLPLLLLLAPAPLTADQARDVRCVATLAIVASEQERGVNSSLAYPPLAGNGARFAQVVGESLMKDTGRGKEQVRDEILAAVAAHQKAATASGRPDDLARAEISDCVELMQARAPAPPPPSLSQCAGLVTLAAREVRQREGGSNTAKDLETFAAVLDSRARGALRGEGKSGPEIDAAIESTRLDIAADALKRQAGGVSGGLDLAACFELAKP